MDLEELSKALVEHWGVEPAALLVPVPEAMNSRVWIVKTSAGRSIVKAVPDIPQFSGGLRVAAMVDRSGLATGAPIATVDGALWVELDGYAIALLRFVDYRGLDAQTPEDRAFWGKSLAQLHARLASMPVPSFADQWPWAVPDASSPFLDIEPWLRPTIDRAVMEAARAWPPEQNRLIHGDPSASDFRVDHDGGLVAVIDWGYAMAGPPFHDLTCAVLMEWLADRDGADVVEAYDRETNVDRDMLEVFLRRRLALQAWWLAWREATASDLGNKDRDWNRQSLATIRQLLNERRWLLGAE